MFKPAEALKLNKHSTKFIAHRGLSSKEKENTLAAFIAAGNRSYYGIEADIHKTIDNNFVVIHDDSTKRVSNVDLSVEKSTLKSLREVQLTDIDGDTSRIDLRIPTLSEYIKICKKYKKECILELKNRFTYEDICIVSDIIKRFDYLDNVTFISFTLKNLIDIKKILPNQKAQYLVSLYSEDVLKTLLKYKLDLDIQYKSLNKEIVKKMHKHNIKVNCWTCDSIEDAKRLIGYGVDFITTNCLE